MNFVALQIKVPIPTKETLPQVAEELKAAAYLEDDDGLEKNFEGQRNSYKRTARMLGAGSPDQSSEVQEYQGITFLFIYYYHGCLIFFI